MPQSSVLAIDIGGTKLAAAVIAEDGTLLTSERAPTTRASSAEDLFREVEQLCRRVLEDARTAIVGIGVGCGGPMEYPAGRVSPLNIPIWRQFPLRERLTDAFGQPCMVDNDAKALALGERWRGAGQGADNMLGMVVSTGVGGGIILDGRLLHGQAGNAGHIGHIVVWPDGPACACGAQGCVESVASGTGLARRLALAQQVGTMTTLPVGANAETIATAARAGDALAAELYRTAGEAVGRGIASAAALLDLELVVVGGSVALHAWDLLGSPLLAEVQASARLAFTRNLRVVHAELGDQAGLYGAALLGFGIA